MNSGIYILALAAASIGFLHTLFGPDHYLPFIVMSKARKWSMTKTTLITILCGIGHVLSSVVLGLVGVGFGILVAKLEFIESVRGNMAAWAMIAFGFVYLIWGIKRAIKNKPHTHFHSHESGYIHSHEHAHSEEHVHVHEKENSFSITPWVLFVIFVLGPCEPLIPILMYPAAKSSIFGMVFVTSVFGIITISTMTGVVLVSSYGLNLLPLKRIERYSHVLAGGIILMSGAAIQFLGL